MHVKEERWVPAIEESANFLDQADPIAKACVPAFYEIVVDSDEYGPSLNNWNLIVYNIFYRLGVIYENLYLLDLAVKEFLKHHHDSSTPDEPKLLQEYVV